MINSKSIKIALIIIFLISIASYLYKSIPRNQIPKQTSLSFEAKKTGTTISTLTPAPQNPNKPKLTDDFITKELIKSDKPIADLVSKSDSFGYSENSVSSTSGYIGKFKYSIFPSKSETDGFDDFPTTFKLFNGKTEIVNKVFEAFRPTGSVEIKSKNQTTRIFKLFTYGAHCCVSLLPVTVKNDEISVGELLDVGNTDVVDKSQFFILENNLYKIVYDDKFAYYGMSFAGSSYAFYPLIYKIDEDGFTNVSSQFKAFYENLYEAKTKEVEQLDTQYIDWEDTGNIEYLTAKKIYLYAIGYLAGHSRSELKNILETRWSNLNIYETGIWEAMANDSVPQYENEKVEYYAELKRFSTSGDMRFYWYDMDKKQRIKPDDEYSWFFALPTKVPSDEKATADWVKYIDDNKNAVFKISGTREPDDCDYYGPDHCIQSVNIESIEITVK